MEYEGAETKQQSSWSSQGGMFFGIHFRLRHSQSVNRNCRWSNWRLWEQFLFFLVPKGKYVPCFFLFSFVEHLQILTTVYQPKVFCHFPEVPSSNPVNKWDSPYVSTDAGLPKLLNRYPPRRLTARTGNTGVGRWVSFWGPASCQVRTVSFGECISSFSPKKFSNHNFIELPGRLAGRQSRRDSNCRGQSLDKNLWKKMEKSFPFKKCDYNRQFCFAFLRIKGFLINSFETSPTKLAKIIPLLVSDGDIQVNKIRCFHFGCLMKRWFMFYIWFLYISLASFTTINVHCQKSTWNR